MAVIYTFGISVVAAFLFAAANIVEPNRRYASVLKFLIVFVNVAAIAGKTDALTASREKTAKDQIHE